jgi:hypothetical protein
MVVTLLLGFSSMITSRSGRGAFAVIGARSVAALSCHRAWALFHVGSAAPAL